jgi:hypothetical protein
MPGLCQSRGRVRQHSDIRRAIVIFHDIEFAARPRVHQGQRGQFNTPLGYTPAYRKKSAGGPPYEN